MLVTRAEHQVFLDELRASCSHPAAGLFGPDSWTWRISREYILFVGAGRAALLQLAHPWVASAVSQHSVAGRDLAGRFHRTFLQLFGMSFGDLDTALSAAQRVHAVHSRVRGPLPDLGNTTPAHPPAQYEANDEEALLWVHATLVDTTTWLFERLVAPMSPQDHEAHYQETRRFARLFGLSDRVLPPDWPAFRRYFDRMVTSSTLTVLPSAKQLSAQLLYPTSGWVTGLWRAHAAITALLLPPSLRVQYGLPFRRRERVLADSTLRLLSRIWPLLPARVRYTPAWFDAQWRLSGKPGRDPRAVAIERRVEQTLLGPLLHLP